jgi:Bacterial lectin/Legume lectin domain/Fibronectin type III domain
MSAGTNPIADGLTFTIQNQPGNWSESVLKLSTTGQLSVADYFTPTDWQTLDNNDADLGSGGTMLLPDAVGSAAHPHLIIETGKTGRMYLIDRDNMGKNNTPNADQNLQTITLGGPGVWGNPAFFQDGPNTGLIYYWGTSVEGKAFRITNGVVDPNPVTQTPFAVGFPGAQPSISSNGMDPNSAIMWALRVDNYAQKGPAALMAFKAEDMSTEIFGSFMEGQRDQFGSSVKFTFPIVSNGHVFAGSNGFLSVFGLFPTPAATPAAPSNLTGTGLAGGSQIQLSWTNNFTAASPATGNKIYRSPDGVTFQQIAQVSRNATTFTDSGLNPATLYYYRVVATNQLGDSPPSNTAAVRTRMAAPVLTIADVCPGAIDLSWSGTANNHYDIKRSTDGTTFTLIATVPVSQTTFMDSGLANGTYFYQVTAVSTFPEGTDTGDSNVAKATIGPITITHFVSPGNPGFTDHSDMVANSSAQFTTENLLRLNNNFGQAGSASEVQRVGIRGFTTSFQVRLHEGTQPNPADGFTFLIQTNGPTALGGGGGALGYQGIPNSIAIKFDVFDNEGESDNSTGLFFIGDFPGLPQSPGEVSIALDPNNVNLRSQSTKTITLTYDGTTLTETIHDPDPGKTNNGDFTTTYTLDIAGRLGADTAFVGFTGGTGGLFSLQDVLNWRYSEQEGNLPPRAPGNLQVTSVVRRDANRSDVALAWQCNNAYTAQGFSVERSTDGANFTQIASLPTSAMTFTDRRVGPGVFYYRVRSLNAQGFSRSSNVVTAEINVPAAPVNLHVESLFAQHVVIAWDPNSSDQTGFQIERSADGVNFTTVGTVDAYTTSFTDVRFAAPVYYRVEALNGNGVPGLPSNVLKVNYVGQFISQDIGNVGSPGTATFDGLGTYSVNASGSDIWDVADSFNFVYEPLSGDGEIVARVVGIQNTDYWTKAGIMIRQDTSPGSPNAFMLETGPGHDEPVFQWRPDANGGTNDSDNHPGGDVGNGPPIWLRLDRVGNTFYGYWAQDLAGHVPGPWQNLGGPQTVNLGTNALVGLALTAHNNGTIANATFDHVTVTQFNPTPLGAPTTLTVAHVVKYKTNSAITVSWHTGSDNETGFRIERSTDGVNFTQIGTAPAGATTFVDTNPDGNGVPAGTYYYRVKAFATGQADSAYSNVDSVRFAQPGSTLTVDHSGGFGNTSDLTTTGSTTIFPNPAPVGTFLGHQDIGGVAAPGGATFDSSGTYTVNASSFDIWDTNDSFQYVYKPLSGDGSIEARVVSEQNTDFWAKAGVMIRETLRSDSRNAFMLETPSGHDEPVFQWRTDPGGFSSDSGNHIFVTQPAPVWLRLVRSGNVFTGYYAADVNNGQGHGAWIQLGPAVTINMATTVYVGLALTGQGGNPNASTFDHVSITGTTGPLPPTVVELTDGGFGEAGGAFLSNRVGVQNFTTSFTFQMTPGTNPMADGMAFVIQGDGPTALGPAGGGLGYGADTVGVGGGLPRSLAIKFDIFDNSGEGTDSTGIFTGGRSPTVRQPGLGAGFPDTSIDLSGTGIDLQSGHPFTVTLGYDGTTLTETIKDTVTSATFTTTYVVNIAALVGSDVGYVGFTGGTGGLSTVTDISSWTLRTTIVKHDTQPQLAAGGPAAPGDATALTADELAPVAEQAVAAWIASGLRAVQAAALQAVRFQIAALGGGVLGLTELGGSVVMLDATAGGYGWFVDPAPADDSEFGSVVTPGELRARPGSPAFGRIDLLTVVEHELGHVLGLGDLDPLAAPHDLLTETLSAGVRRFPTPAAQVATPAADSPAAPADPLAMTVPAATTPNRANPALPPAAAPALAPSLPDRPAVAAGQSDVVFTAVPLDPETHWVGASAVVRPADDLRDASRDALFAQPADPDEFPDLPGGDPGAARV